jgi:hypothetical protein
MTGLIRGRERVTLCRGIVKDAAQQEWNNQRYQQGSPLRAPRSGIGHETRAN